MSSPSRALLLSTVLLVVFALVALSLQWWLSRQAGTLRSELAETARQRLAHALALAPRPAEAWDDDYRAQLGALIGGTVALQSAEVAPPAAAAPAAISVSLELPGQPAWRVHAILRPAGLERLQQVQQRALAAMVLLAILLAGVPLLAATLTTRRPESASRAPWSAARAEAAGIEQFARLTVERGAALEREHGARVRAEEDLLVSRSLLDRSLEDRIRLGRELHDNISQTLYAVNLTLESVRKNMSAAPAFEQRLDQCMAELKRLNQEVRAHIRDLEPATVQRGPFAAAVTEMLAGLAVDGVQIEQRLEADAVALLPPQHTVDLVNLLREAVSNSVRHGRARRITIRAARGEHAVALAIADDGVGFTPGRGSGHGLGNMAARATAMGGTLQVDSAPGKGTRVLLTLPVDSTP